MRCLLLTALIGCTWNSLGALADDENLFKKSNLGDWVEYKMTSASFEGKTKLTIVSKDDKEVIYEVAAKISFMGNEMVAPIQKVKVDLTKPYDPIVAANLMGNGVKIDKMGEGKEKLKIGDKEYDTKWTKFKATATVGDVVNATEYKMWFSKDVPLSGLVKMETATAGVTTKLEILDSGSK